MKTCSSCKCAKAKAEFYTRVGAKDGLNGRCKVCVRASTAAWINAHPKEHNAHTKKWAELNPEKVYEKGHRWWKNNLEQHAANTSAWHKSHRPMMNAALARYKATRLQATPAWANEFFIEEAYDLAARRTKLLGFKWDVDHIVPLQSRIVCGLHVENNLQVVPSKINQSKGNRYWPDMSQETS